MSAHSWKSRNIFEDVLHHEDALTDAFRNFLKYPIVQEALWRTLPKEVGDQLRSCRVEDIETRPSSDVEERPDLVILGDSFLLLIEVKLGASLTPPQREAYVGWLRRRISQELVEGKAFVAFLVPDDYAHQAELASSLENARRRKSPNITILCPITWQEFVQALGSLDMTSMNELIREFYSHLSKRFEPLTLHTEETRLMHCKETAKGILNLRCVVEKVKSKLESRGIKKSRLNAYAYGYDFSCRGGEGAVYFGIWLEFWADQGLPLCVAISSNSPSAIREAFVGQYKGQVQHFLEGQEEYLVTGYRLPDSPTDSPNDGSELIERIAEDVANLLQ